MIPALQLRTSDVPELGFPGDTDTFQLLWCPVDHPETGYAPLPLGRWRRLAPGPVAPPPEPGPGAVYVPRPCVLSPERVDELPSAFELEVSTTNELDEAIAHHAAADLERLGITGDSGLYQRHFSVAPGTKVGGYVGWVQDPRVPTCRCGAPMEHLLTIASAEFDGAYQRWMPLEERHVWREGFDARHAVQSAADLMFGDMGSFYVFVCRRCPERPVSAVSQGS
jgi:hypothetical protein